MTIIRPAASMACRPLPDISRATDATSAALLAFIAAFITDTFHGKPTVIRKPV